MPFDFQQLANFRLARGSHKQPNKDGNICVNEAAVIVAGFQYREIRDVSCLPDCFSRPLSEYAIYLNDFMMHRVRNELLAPFVTRLPGTSDAPGSRSSAPGSSLSKPFAVSLRPNMTKSGASRSSPRSAGRCSFSNRFLRRWRKRRPCCPWNARNRRSKGSAVVYIPTSASVLPAPPRLRQQRVPSGRGSARVPIEKSGRWPPSSSRKPSCLGEMTGSTIPWRQLSGWNGRRS
jgi:hypothetical protein